MSKLDQMLQGLAASSGMSSAIDFNEHGVASFDVDGKLTLCFQKARENQALQIYCAVGLVPVMNRESFYRKALEANLFGADTLGSVLAIDPEFNEVVLSQLVDPHLVSDQDFLNLLDDFIGVALGWREKLNVNRWELPQAPQIPEKTLAAPTDMAAHFMNRA